MHGVIAASEDDIDLKIYVQSDQRGECMAYFFIEIEDGAPVTFQVVCNFRGPIVLCHQPLVDFGLVKVNTLEQYQMEIENTSPIPAQVLIKNSLNKNLGFNNMMSMQQAASQVAKDSSAASSIYDRPNTTKKGNQISIEQCAMILKPHEKQTVQVSLKSARPETVEEYFEIMVEDGLS
jgi:rRNA maturation protein Rpf1